MSGYDEEDEYGEEDFYVVEEEEEEEETCPEGFTEDEDCGAPFRLGIEFCEFMCPFHRLDGLLDLTVCYYCGAPIRKGDILCDKCRKGTPLDPDYWKDEEE
jgi:hypothetical protein